MNRYRAQGTEKASSWRELCGRTISIVDEIERAAMLGFTEEERELYLSLFRRHLENLKKARAELLGETENK